MINAHLLRSLGATAAVLTVSVGCATRTKVTQRWEDPSHVRAVGPIHRVVVFGPNVPGSTRASVEDKFVADFRDKGVNAEPSYKIFGDDTPEMALARPRLVSAGYDGALVLKVAKVETQTKAPPQANLYATPYGAPVPAPYDYMRLTTEYTMLVDSSLWDLRDEKPVWNSTTKLENVTSKDFAKRVSRNVIPELSSKGFVAK